MDNLRIDERCSCSIYSNSQNNFAPAILGCFVFCVSSQSGHSPQTPLFPCGTPTLAKPPGGGVVICVGCVCGVSWVLLICPKTHLVFAFPHTNWHQQFWGALSFVSLTQSGHRPQTQVFPCSTPTLVNPPGDGVVICVGCVCGLRWVLLICPNNTHRSVA